MAFHSEDYIDFLSRVTPEHAHEYAAQMQKCTFSSQA